MEHELLPKMVLPDNSTVADTMLPRLREISPVTTFRRCCRPPSPSPGAGCPVTGRLERWIRSDRENALLVQHKPHREDE